VNLSKPQVFRTTWIIEKRNGKNKLFVSAINVQGDRGMKILNFIHIL
jgi:hypothetical protein